MVTLKEIEALTKRYSELAAALHDAVDALEAEKAAVTRQHLPGIKRLLDRAKPAKAELSAAIDASPELFVKPRTVTFHGVRVGFVKQPGRVEFDDADQVVKLIRKHFPDRFEFLVKTTYAPIKKALGQLRADEVKKLGVSVTDDTDEVLIKDTSSEIEKAVESLLKDEPEEVSA